MDREMRPPDAAELFDRHHQVVFRFLRRMIGSSSVAEDLTQEVFLRIVRGLDDYQERSREISWVFRIARNVLIDRHRAQARSPVGVPLETAPPNWVPANQPLGVELDQALARLPDEDREAFLMREVGGLGYQEIAGATGATPDAARMRIYRARIALREALAPTGRADQRSRKEVSK